jgi:hypothetical protein
MKEVPPENPKDDNTRASMKKIGDLVDNELPQGWGFIVLCYPFGHAPGRMNYISNGKREDTLQAMREFLAKANGENFGKHA